MSAHLKGKSISKAFDDAIAYFGDIKALASAVGISAAHARRLRKGQYKLRREHALKIEQATNGKIKADEFNENILSELEENIKVLEESWK